MGAYWRWIHPFNKHERNKKYSPPSVTSDQYTFFRIGDNAIDENGLSQGSSHKVSAYGAHYKDPSRERFVCLPPDVQVERWTLKRIHIETFMPM